MVQRKSIYDDESSTTPSAPASSPTLAPPAPSDAPSKPRGPTPTDRLAVQVGHARLFLHRQAVQAEGAINRTMDSAFNLEHSFTSTVASLAPPRESGEKLMPGAIYVLVAGMAGSIVTRNRNILFRATAPLALGLVAANSLLPITSRNVSELVWTYEKRFPAVAESHLKAREQIAQGLSFAKAHGRMGAQYVDDKVSETRENVEGWVKQGK